MSSEPLVARALALTFADFVDLKSPHTLGHSRNGAALAEGAAREIGPPSADQERLALASEGPIADPRMVC